MVTPEELTKKRVGDALQHLKPALSAFVSRKMQARFGGYWIERTSPARPGSTADSLDNYALLKTMLDQWSAVFREAFGPDYHDARNYVSFAFAARNALAHERTLSDADGVRYLDSMLQLARLIGAPGGGIATLKALYDEQRLGRDGSPAVAPALAAPQRRLSPLRGSPARQGFREFLGSDRGKAAGGPLTAASINDYCSYVRSIELLLGVNLDEEDLSSDGVVATIDRMRANKKMAGLSDKDISNWSSGLRAYARYRALGVDSAA